MESISAMENSLASLEDVLAPLLETDLSETEAKLDTLQRAKLQTILPYVVHSLVFSYLRSKDADTANHAVTPELERMAQYFSKTKNAGGTEKRTLMIDQEAATRFIKHAIKEAVSGDTRGSDMHLDTTEPSTSTSVAVMNRKTKTTQIPSTSTSTQTTITGAQPTPAALAKIEERMKLSTIDDSTHSDDELMIVDEDSVPSPSSKAEGKRKAREDSTTDLPKRRKGMDPWAGFDDSPRSVKQSAATSTPVRQNVETNTNTTPSLDTPQEVVSAPSTNKYAKPRKPRTKKKQQQQNNVQVIDVDAEPSPTEDSQQQQSIVQQALSVLAESSASGSNTTGKGRAKKARRNEAKRNNEPIIISD